MYVWCSQFGLWLCFWVSAARLKCGGWLGRKNIFSSPRGQRQNQRYLSSYLSLSRCHRIAFLGANFGYPVIDLSCCGEVQELPKLSSFIVVY